MAKSTAKKTGSGLGEKGDGSGAMTDLQRDLVGDNMILSNRDKAQHSSARGQDSKWVETEQQQDHAANRDPD